MTYQTHIHAAWWVNSLVTKVFVFSIFHGTKQSLVLSLNFVHLVFV